MNISITLAAVAATAVALLLAGCTSSRQYRKDPKICVSIHPETDCTNAILEEFPDAPTKPGYKLGYVEFDDQGWFWDVNQLSVVKDMIRKEMGLGGPGKPNGIVIVLFVHGWKNNAASDNPNVALFRGALGRFAEAEASQSELDKRGARKVVGVYAGWRGLSATVEPFKELSFWERKNTAHKVGGYGAMSQLLVDLEELQKQCNTNLVEGALRTELIFVGHSFGGAAMYSAIGQIITERFEQTLAHGTPLKPLGDQVILLNPAFEASRHYNLNSMAVTLQTYPEAQRPVLSIFTSKGDWATHYAFPVGRFFSTLFETDGKKPGQRAANRQAVGWYKPFVTHDLLYDTNAAATPSDHTTWSEGAKKHLPHSDPERLRSSLRNVLAQRDQWKPNRLVPLTYSFDDCLLKPCSSYRAGDPMLVVSVDKQIMKDHDDIANPVMLNFLREYILFCQKEPVYRTK